MKRVIQTTTVTTVCLLLAYLCIACDRYRFMHPEQTETQLLLNLPDALTWKH